MIFVKLYIFYYGEKAVDKFLNWKVLRSFGELQILTRASYLAIILIPIVAGIWPSVRVAINHYNKVAISASNHLDSASASLKENIEKLRHIDVIKIDLNKETALEVEVAVSGIVDEAKKMVERVEVFRHRFDPKQLDIPTLPMVWVFAFSGSVFIVIGHLIYQSGVPEIVRQNSKIEHVRVACSKLALEGGSSHKYDISNIEKKAKMEYEDASVSGLIFVKAVALAFYLAGLICIIVVFIFQINAVLKAAGMITT